MIIYALRWKKLSKRCLTIEGPCFYLPRCSRVRISKGMCSFCLSQHSFMVSYVHSALGHPTLLCSTWCGRSVLVTNVAWCCGWSEGFPMIWPNRFLRLSRKMSLSGRMIPPAPTAISKFARLNTSRLVFVRSIYVVDIFNFFLKPFNWNVPSLAAVPSVAEVHLNCTGVLKHVPHWTLYIIFHLLDARACYQNRSSFFSIGIVCEIRRFIAVLGSTPLLIRVPR